MHTHAHGFTVIELLVVISIIAMLASVVLVSLSEARDKGRVAAAVVFDSTNHHSFGWNANAYFNFDQGANWPTNFTFDNIPVSYSLVGCTSFKPTDTDCPSGYSAKGDTPTGNGYSFSIGNVYNAYMDAAYAKSFRLTSYTISAWVKPTTIVGTDSFVVRGYCWSSPECASTDVAFKLDMTGGSASGYSGLDFGPGTDLQSFVVTIPAGKWTLITYSYSSAANQFVLYIDGRLRYTHAGSPGIDYPTNGYVNIVRVGSDDVNKAFTGDIENVAVYPQALNGN